jgi:hypothetical protein
VWTQGLVLAKQILCHLSHASILIHSSLWLYNTSFIYICTHASIYLSITFSLYIHLLMYT